MSIAQSRAEESDEIHGPGRPKPIRLSEVGQIAAERLDGDGALQEVAALRPSSEFLHDSRGRRNATGGFRDRGDGGESGVAG